MTQSLIWWIAILASAAVMVALARRARGIHSRVPRWLAMTVAGLLGGIALVVAAISGYGFYKAYAPRNYPVQAITVVSSPQRQARGEHLASVICAPCHGRNGDLPLTGGANLSDDIGLPLGNLYPANLTPVGEIATWSDGEVMRAIREGLHQNGRPLTMPVSNLRNLSDEDTQSIVAYLRSQPPAGERRPDYTVSPLAGLLLGLGAFDLEARPLSGPVVAPAKGPTLDYGRYVFSISDCRSCHGERLDGVPIPPAPAGPSLRGAATWSTGQFTTAIRTGVVPSGRQMGGPMPWRQIGRLEDDELTALFIYVQSVAR